jgi:hypothetical protein
LQALMTFCRDAGDVASALDYAERLARSLPNDVTLAALVNQLRRQLGGPEGK